MASVDSIPQHPEERPSRFSHDYVNAAINEIPTTNLLSVEYPGYIAPAESSVQRAISTLGGPRRIQSYLSGTTPHLELNYGRISEDHVVQSRWKHPIPASAAQGDKLVVRVRKRSKIRVWTDLNGVERRDVIDAGEYTVDMVGAVAKTLRFRCMSSRRIKGHIPTSICLASERLLI